MRKVFAGVIVVLLASSALANAQAQTAALKAPVVWNLSELYPTDAAWDAEAKAVAAALPALAGYKGMLGKDAASLAGALRAVSDLQKRVARLETYATLKRDEDTRVAPNQERLQRVQLLATDFGSATAYIDPEVVAIGQAKIDQLIAAEPNLKVFAFRLHDILRNAPHTLGDEAEGVLAAAATATGAPRTIYTLLANADIPWPTVTLSDGKQVRIDSQAYTGTRDLPNRDDRKKVFEAFFGKFTEYKASIGATLDANVEGTVFNAKVRHYPNSVSYKIAEHNIPEQVYRTLVDEANKGLPALYRYFALRKKMLGLPQLHYYDMYVPLVKSDRKYTVDDAEAMTLTAVAPLGPDYVAALKAGFASSWMHALPQPGKKPGAYMDPSAYDVHPYVLSNFTGNYDSVTTIAHEWGHAMHSVLASKAQPFETANYPIFLAEIASTNNEMLLQDNLIANAKTNTVAQITIPVAERLGQNVVDFEGMSKGFGDNLLIDNLTFKLPPGGIVGVIGPNGAGKTTLFRMITGQDKPDKGTIKIGESVQLGYVDQSRDSLDPRKNIWEEISNGQDLILVGKKEVNSRAYVSLFNFKGADQQKKVGTLSGGERNRVHLAKMLRAGANLLLLDEPTNDLDVDTLRALEEALEDFAGCAVIISHDRWFLDRIATHILAFEGDSHVEWFEGNFQDYEKDKMRRLGQDSIIPHRLKYKKFSR